MNSTFGLRRHLAESGHGEIDGMDALKKGSRTLASMFHTSRPSSLKKGKDRTYTTHAFIHDRRLDGFITTSDCDFLATVWIVVG